MAAVTAAEATMHNAWKNRKSDLKRRISAGGSMVKNAKRRKLTEQEIESGAEADTGRKLSDYELSKGMKLIERPWTEDQLQSSQA